MSFGTKRILVGMGVGTVMLVVYLIFALGTNAPAPDDIKAWALAMLIFIGIAVVAVIVLEILFHIAYSIGIAAKQHRQGNEKIERIISVTIAEDERDKQIYLMAARIGYRVSGVGLLLVLVAFAFGIPMVFALHLMIAAFFLGCFAEGVASIVYHEKGIQHA